MGSDEQVVRANQGASPPEVRANLRAVPRGVLGELQDLDVEKEAHGLSGPVRVDYPTPAIHAGRRMNVDRRRFAKSLTGVVGALAAGPRVTAASPTPAPAALVEICRLMEPSRPFCVEAPVREEQFRTQIPKLRLLTTVPLAPCQEWGTRAEVQALVEQRDIDFARASLPNVGGITEMLKIIAVCDTTESESCRISPVRSPWLATCTR